MSRNSSYYSVKPLEIGLAPSRRLKRLVIGMHVLCLTPVFLLSVGWQWQAGILALLAASLVFSLRQLKGPLHGLNLAMDGMLTVRLAGGQWVPAEVLGSSFVKPWLTVLHLRLEGRRKFLPLVLFPDMLPPDDFRRLRMWLLWGWTRAEER